MTHNDKLIIYQIFYKGHKFYGYSLCHPDDADFYSKTFGTTLARMRAEVKLYEFKRKEENRKSEILGAALRAMTREEQASAGGQRLARQIVEANAAAADFRKRKEAAEEDIKRYIGHKEAFNIWYRKHKKKDKNQ